MRWGCFMKNVLIIGAHFDDSELGAGGTAAKLLDEGKNVYKITLTNTEVIDDFFKLDIRADVAKQNSRKACEEIGGVQELEIHPAQYGLLEYNQFMMKEIERLIERYKIDTVFIHYNEDYNTDHVAAHNICKTAARHCKNILMYQSNPYILADGYKPNFFVDISSYIEHKRRALNCYDNDHNRKGRLFETNIQRNEVWGYGNGVQYAEGFISIRYMYEE